jgi:NYN domain-containing protein
LDRCALFVDAGYVLADGALAVHGTRHRESVAWDYAGLLQLLSSLAGERTGLPVLRCYWYEAAVEGRRTPEHEALADLPGLKLRLGRMRPGRREGVDTEIHRDLSTLARNHAISDAVIVSAEEDLAHVIGDIQDLGVRVTLVNITVDGDWTIARLLRQECDSIIEIGGPHLQPFVNLIAGAEPAKDQPASGQYAGAPLANGHAPGRHGAQHMLPAAHTHSPPSVYTPQAAVIPEPPYAQPWPEPAAAQQAPAGQSQPAAHERRELPAAPSSAAAPPHGQSPQGQQPQAHVQMYAAPTPAQPAAAPPSGATVTFQEAQHATPAAVYAPTTAGGHAGLAGPGAAGPPGAGGTPQPGTYVPPQQGPFGGPQPAAPPQAGPAAMTLADATVAAHAEGLDFGGSVARDAPALWLEAVLARKPRMPSDLEARLLQGSVLPIDYLLHDEVRHALRRGFWDALERSRR